MNYRDAAIRSGLILALAAGLAGCQDPAIGTIRAELQTRLQVVLNGMDPIDREVLALRHFEDLSNAETAAVLGLQKSAASNRYIRALKRLKEILDALPGGFEL